MLINPVSHGEVAAKGKRLGRVPQRTGHAGHRGSIHQYQLPGLRRAEGKLIERDAEGFHARVVQHECDHLDGILYPSRITDMRYFGFEDVLFPELTVANE